MYIVGTCMCIVYCFRTVDLIKVAITMVRSKVSGVSDLWSNLSDMWIYSIISLIICTSVLSMSCMHDDTGRVWSLQHLCRVAIRRHLGAARRRRIKELPLPKHLLSFLCTLPVARSEQLHQNWERTKTSKAELVRKRGEARKPKQSRYASGLQAFRQQWLKN